jgi:hypothetical protein
MDQPTVPVQLTADELELLASMRRHPAGSKQRLRECPTCGQNASGALGDVSLELVPR